MTDPRYMLAHAAEEGRFKLYSSDTGMPFAQYPTGFALAALGGARNINFGPVYENAVAQELAAAQTPPRYCHCSRRGKVDFLLETRDAHVLPVEVKSDKDYKLHMALNNLLGTAGYDIDEAIVLSEAPVSVGEREGKPAYYLPLYIMHLVAQVAASPADGSLDGTVLQAPSFE